MFPSASYQLQRWMASTSRSQQQSVRLVKLTLMEDMIRMLKEVFALADRYCAKVAGLLPDDPWAAALADQAYFFVEDVMKVRKQ